MRLAWYTSASTALAAGVVISAFHQRANFYSAMVYLSQSSFCLIVLVNFILMAYTAFMYGLQRLFFGALRQVETEQLYERTWYAITETLLAMTMFRDEIGAWFLVMFTALVTGRVWGWICDGRVETLEQQPPQSPRLFHARLTASLLISIIYDLWILRYVVDTVIDQAKRTMMVMFLFEFAVLSVHSARTTVRYGISLYDHFVTARQTREGLERKRKEIRDARADILRRREAEGPESEAHNEPLPDEEDVDEIDIEVPGWEHKGLFILGLELVIDVLKCLIYIAFFSILLVFFTMPLHIMRDLFFTFRSLLRRINALMKYRRAVREMDRYPDATEEELARENTCIICREEMRPWAPTPDAVERSRPKKLPCGHILHFGCLKSWLERQQVCPTCRRPVTDNQRDQVQARGGVVGDQGQQPPANQDGARGDQPQQRNRGGMRVFQFGPIRLGFAQGNPNQLQEMADRFNAGEGLLQPNEEHNQQQQQGHQRDHDTGVDHEPVGGNIGPTNLPSSAEFGAQLWDLEQRMLEELRTLQNQHQETHVAQLLVAELARLRQLNQQANIRESQAGSAAVNPGPGGAPSPQPPQVQPAPIGLPPFPSQPLPQMHWPPAYGFPPRVMTPTVTRHVGPSYGSAIPAGSTELPEGVVIPPGWSLLPLQRMDAVGQPGMATASLQSSQQISQLMQQHLNSLQQQQPPASLGEAGSSRSPATANPESQRDLNGAGGSTGEAPNSTQGPAATLSAPEPGGLQTAGHVAAPTPVLPNWGGRSQLFGVQVAGENEADGPLFGDNGEGSGSGGFADANDAIPQPQNSSSEGSSAGHASSGSSEADASSSGMSSKKDMGRQVTVEDAPESEE